jgi:hypothetical protein
MTLIALLFVTASRPALGPTQSPIPWVLGALSQGLERPVPEAETHHLVPRLRMLGAMPTLAHTSSRRGGKVSTRTLPLIFT